MALWLAGNAAQAERRHPCIWYKFCCRWKQGTQTAHDEIVVMEVMIGALDRPWWAKLRRELTAQFRQEEIVIRCQPIERL